MRRFRRIVLFALLLAGPVAAARMQGAGGARDTLLLLEEAHLAAMGERTGVDLWNHRTADGRSLRAALDFLVPFAGGAREWPGQQITPFRPAAMYWLLRRAAAVWQEPKYADLAAKVGPGGPRMELTLPSHGVAPDAARHVGSAGTHGAEPQFPVRRFR